MDIYIHQGLLDIMAFCQLNCHNVILIGGGEDLVEITFIIIFLSN